MTERPPRITRSGPLGAGLRRVAFLLVAALVLGIASPVRPARAAPIRIYAAGSLTAAMQALVKASGLPPESFATPVFGPAGLLRERLAGGEAADLFASADLAQPHWLAASDSRVLVVPFARNRMCVAAKASVGLTPANLLDRLLDPKLRLATSTPGADPGGDYALAVFDRAERLHPGAAAILGAKALHRLGGPNTMTPLAGHTPAASIFLGDEADALLYYCSSATALATEVADVVNLPLPETLEVHPTYGLAVLSTDPDSARFALFILSERGQKILSGFGFLPIGPGD